MDKQPTSCYNCGSYLAFGGSGKIMDKIGQRIRTFRKQRGYSLTKFAEELGISLSYMSQIESGKSNISVAMLIEIAKKLELSSISLLLEDTPKPDVEIIRAEERKTYVRNDGDATIDILFATASRQLEATIIHLPVDAENTKKSEVHRGDEFCYVIQGKATLYLEERGAFDLKAGDVASYPADIPHRLKNTGQSPCEILIACTPVSF
jgi:transcriptional regulator with XRE-family HTH domain